MPLKSMAMKALTMKSALNMKATKASAMKKTTGMVLKKAGVMKVAMKSAPMKKISMMKVVTGMKKVMKTDTTKLSSMGRKKFGMKKAVFKSTSKSSTGSPLVTRSSTIGSPNPTKAIYASALRSKLIPSPIVKPKTSAIAILPKDQILWPYPIGEMGIKWGVEEKEKWFHRADQPQRLYEKDVLQKLALFEQDHGFNQMFVIEEYGRLQVISAEEGRYPLKLIRTKPDLWDMKKKTVLITGGVHGYEKSGVQGALLFVKENLCTGIGRGTIINGLPKTPRVQPLQGVQSLRQGVTHPDEESQKFKHNFNLIIVPCISPWGYECIQRWNAQAIDVNRSFVESDQTAILQSKAEVRTQESSLLMEYLDKRILGASMFNRKSVYMHIDLHETTHTDATEFRPAKHAREGTHFDFNSDSHIEYGFFLVGDTNIIEKDPLGRQFYEHVLKTVENNGGNALKLSSSARRNNDGGDFNTGTLLYNGKSILGIPLALDTQGRVMPTVPVDNKPLALSASMCLPSARFVATTEINPDAIGEWAVTEKQCNQAQCAAIVGALDFVTKYCNQDKAKQINGVA